MHFLFQNASQEFDVNAECRLREKAQPSCELLHQMRIRQSAKSDSRLRGPAPHRYVIPLRRRLVLAASRAESTFLGDTVKSTATSRNVDKCQPPDSLFWVSEPFPSLQLVMPLKTHRKVARKRL